MTKEDLYNVSLTDSGYFSKSFYPTLLNYLESNNIFNVGALLDVLNIDVLEGALSYKKKLTLIGIVDLIKYEYFNYSIDSAVFLDDEVVVLEDNDYFSRWRYQKYWANDKLPRMGFDYGDIKDLRCFIEELAKEGKYSSLKLIDIFNMYNLKYPDIKLMINKKVQLYSNFYSEQAALVDDNYANICRVRKEIELLKQQRSEIDLLISKKEGEIDELLKVSYGKVYQKTGDVSE